MTDRKEAMKLALQWEDAARRRLTEAQARRVLSDIHEQIHGTSLAASSATEYAGQWIARKKGETAPTSFALYVSVVNRFLAHLGAKAGREISHLTPADIASFRDAVAAQSSSRTGNNVLKIVRTLLQSAWRDGYVVENVAAKVGVLKAAESKRRPFTLAEVKRLLDVAKGSEWQGMILAGVYTGQRLGDIARLRWSNIDLATGEIALRTSKTGRTVIVPLAEPLREWLLAQPGQDEPSAPLFPKSCNRVETEQTSARLSQSFYDGVLVPAGLAPPTDKSKKGKGIGRLGARKPNPVTFHSLRHTATSWLKDAGVSEAIAMDLIGHDSAAVSRHYTRISSAAKRDAIAKLPDLRIGH